MTRICPVCNGLTTLSCACVYCQSQMLDYGQVHNLLDPYAPFEEDELVQQSQTSIFEGYCQHLAYCNHCKRKTAVKVPLLAAPASPPPIHLDRQHTAVYQSTRKRQSSSPESQLSVVDRR